MNKLEEYNKWYGLPTIALVQVIIPTDDGSSFRINIPCKTESDIEYRVQAVKDLGLDYEVLNEHEVVYPE